MRPLDRLREQLVRAVRAESPSVPEAGRLLWRAFVALHNSRTVTMAGPQAITYAEIDAWLRATRTPLEADHVAILRAMDDAWLRSVRETGIPGSTKDARMSSQEITPAYFDAVFG